MVSEFGRTSLSLWADMNTPFDDALIHQLRLVIALTFPNRPNLKINVPLYTKLFLQGEKRVVTPDKGWVKSSNLYSSITYVIGETVTMDLCWYAITSQLPSWYVYRYNCYESEALNGVKRRVMPVLMFHCLMYHFALIRSMFNV